MIKLNNLDKKFGKQIVFDKFSYTFGNRGLYVLFGESGCGKTTLLNLICGIEGFDGGTIEIDNRIYDKKVSWEDLKSKIGYMTQDVYWIDYLTVGEQLELLGNSKTEILNCLSTFGLQPLYDRYFSELSGGQRQRVFLAQFLLQKKEILLLDEPTASLDSASKKAVFEMLHSIKDDVLILCSSHDKEILPYSDAALPISPSINDCCEKEAPPLESRSKNTDEPVVCKNKALFPYFIKWFSWKGREKKSLNIMLFIYVLVFLSLFIADTPSSKEAASMKQLYRINQCIVSVDNTKNFESVVQNCKSDLLDAVLVYNGSCPDYNQEKEPIDTVINTIPKDKKAFNYSDKILYGSYFTSKNQMILSYNKALEYGNPEEIIGESITLNMYDGNREFEIIGVFDAFSERENQYLNQSLSPEVNGIFINSEYTKSFAQDRSFNWNNKKTFVLYFNSYRSMKAFVKNNQNASDFEIMESNVDYGIISHLEMMFYVLLPCVAVVAFCAILFYFQTKKLEILYNPHLISLYAYLGFEQKEIERCWILGNLIENIITVFTSGILAVLIASVLNVINYKADLFPFVVFTYNLQILFGFVLFNIIFACLICKANFKTISKIKWYTLFLQQRDLL